MNQNRQPIIILFACVYVMVLSSTSRCEFYEYVDKNGVKCYTDDQSRIPEKEREKTRIHAEKYDGFSDDYKTERMKEEQQELLDIKKKQVEFNDQHRKWTRLNEQEEREKKYAQREWAKEIEKAAREKKRAEDEKKRLELKKKQAESASYRRIRFGNPK